jgi:hypothetical protein
MVERTALVERVGRLLLDCDPSSTSGAKPSAVVIPIPAATWTTHTPGIACCTRNGSP